MALDSSFPERHESLPPQSPHPEHTEFGPAVLSLNGAKILDREPGQFVFGSLGNIVVVVWRQQATLAALARLTKAVNGMQQHYPEGCSSIHVVIEGTEPPTGTAERVILKLMRRSQVPCVAVVILGSGFWASRLRSSTTALTLKIRGFELRQQGSIEELGAWLPKEHLKLTGHKIDAAKLCTVVAAFAEL